MKVWWWEGLLLLGQVAVGGKAFGGGGQGGV